VRSALYEVKLCSVVAEVAERELVDAVHIGFNQGEHFPVVVHFNRVDPEVLN